MHQRRANDKKFVYSRNVELLKKKSAAQFCLFVFKCPHINFALNQHLANKIELMSLPTENKSKKSKKTTYAVNRAAIHTSTVTLNTNKHTVTRFNCLLHAHKTILRKIPRLVFTNASTFRGNFCRLSVCSEMRPLLALGALILAENFTAASQFHACKKVMQCMIKKYYLFVPFNAMIYGHPFLWGFLKQFENRTQTSNPPIAMLVTQSKKTKKFELVYLMASVL